MTTQAKRSEFFKLQELVDRATYAKHGEAAWHLLNPTAFKALEDLRRFFNAGVTVNTWLWGGGFEYRGLRGQDCKIGSLLSEHKRGNAFDCDVRGYTAEQARQAILEHQDDPLLQKIQRLEGGVNWLHFDLGWPPQGKQRIYVFRA